MIGLIWYRLEYIGRYGDKHLIAPITMMRGESSTVGKILNAGYILELLNKCEDSNMHSTQ